METSQGAAGTWLYTEESPAPLQEEFHRVAHASKQLFGGHIGLYFTNFIPSFRHQASLTACVRLEHSAKFYLNNVSVKYANFIIQ